jgi:hypothetical protein
VGVVCGADDSSSPLTGAEGVLVGLGLAVSEVVLSLRAATTEAVICLRSSSFVVAAMKALLVAVGAAEVGSAAYGC